MPLAIDLSEQRGASQDPEPSKPKESKKERGGSLASPNQMMMTGSMVRLSGDNFSSGSSPQNFSNGPHPRMPKFHEFQCPLCPRSYAQKCSLYRHMKVHKNDKINESEVQHAPCATGEGQFKCPFCIASYTNSASLNVHVRTHAVGYRDMVRKPDKPREEEKVFPCPLCKRIFQRRSRLTVHLNISHRNENSYREALPPPGEEDDGDVDSELEDDQDPMDLSKTGSASPADTPKGSSTNGTFACHLCGSSYTRRTNLNKHLEKRHNIDQTYLLKSQFHEMAKKHMTVDKRNMEEEMRAKIMGKQQMDSDDSTVHQCPFCTFRTSHRFTLYQHLTTSHSNLDMLRPPVLDREAGNTKGKTPEDAKEEGSEEGNGEFFPCSFCSRVYMRKCNLTQHLKMHFQEDMEMRKKMSGQSGNSQEGMEQFCNEVEDEVEEVRRIIEMTKAQDNKDKNDVHECAICGLTFGVRANLLLHLQMHEKRALEKMKNKKSSPDKGDGPPPLIRPPMPGMPLSTSPGPSSSAGSDSNAFVMTQDKDGKTTIHNQQAYMLSHLQVLNQVQQMLMYGRQMPPGLSPPGGLPSSTLPKKRLSTGSLDDENPMKKLRPGPKPGRHWKSLECDPNRRPFKKCSLCPFEIDDRNHEGLLQHMAAMHGVRCKLCPSLKFFAKRDFDDHCSQTHGLMCQANEMEQLMVFGEIVDSGYKIELVDPSEGDAASTKSEDTDKDESKREASAPPSPRSFSGDERKSISPMVDNLQDEENGHEGSSFHESPSMAAMGLPSPGESSSTSMRQVCPKCGLHYAQKSSLNRHIRTHHNYSRVEEMVKAESMGASPIDMPLPKKLKNKEMEHLPPFLPLGHGPPPLLPPGLLHMTPGLPPPPSLMAEMSRLIPRNLLFGQGLPPSGPPDQESLLKRFLNSQEELADPAPRRSSSDRYFHAIRPNLDDEQRSTPDDEVTAINLSMNSVSSPVPEDLSVRKDEPEDLSQRPSPAVTPKSPVVTPQPSKGRSRRKPQVVQRIVRNTTWEEEEEEEKEVLQPAEPQITKDPPSDHLNHDSDEDSIENEYGPQGFTDKNANHLEDKDLMAHSDLDSESVSA